MIQNYRACIAMVCLLGATGIYGADANNAASDKDTDYDGLPDQIEERLGTDPWLSDTDGDGLKDGQEVGDDFTKPLDSDGDQRIDALDVDDDGDGIPTVLESTADTDEDGKPDYMDQDADGDGKPDRDEAGTPDNPGDSDNDGLIDHFDADHNGAEDANGDGVDGKQLLPDRDQDGTPDIRDANDDDGPAGNSDKADLSGKSKSSEQLPVSEPEEHVPDLEKIADVPAEQTTDTDDDAENGQIRTLSNNIFGKDTDGDGLDDELEIGLYPDTPVDTDGDGIADFRDPDDDGDGLATLLEGEGDRDGDGRVDYLDVDPSGYFYCAKDGRLVSGIHDFRLVPEEGVKLLASGEKGIFHWLISKPGTYSLQFVLPEGMKTLQATDNGQLYVTPFNGDFVSLGRGEDIGRAGYLASFNANDLPDWFSAFSIQEGAPPVINMNIPLVGGECGDSPTGQ